MHRDVWAASDIQSSDKEDMMIGKESTRALNCSQTPQILEVCSSQHQPWNRNAKIQTHKYKYIEFLPQDVPLGIGLGTVSIDSSDC